MILKTSLRGIAFALGAVCCFMLNVGCKKAAKDNFVHVDVYSQAGARYSPILEARFRHFSRERAKLPSGRKIMVSSVMEEGFENRLADPVYRGQAQVIVLASEQQAAADPNLAEEFTHARQGCNEKIPCYLLIPSSVAGEQREAAEQLVDYIATQANPPASGQTVPSGSNVQPDASATTQPQAAPTSSEAASPTPTQ